MSSSGTKLPIEAADLPVQVLTKFKTAKALGIEIPATLTTRADKVIE